MIREEVPAALDGERLDRVVALVADISRAQAATLVRDGAVSVDGRVATQGRDRLRTGQSLEIDPSGIVVVQLPAADDAVAFEVVYADESIIVVNKPAGLVVHPGSGNPDRTLVNGLLARFPEIEQVGDPTRPGIVHRLDAGSSGLLVVARTPAALEHLIGQFSRREATRRYIALVWGHPDAPHGIIDAPIGRDRRDPLRMAVVADGREARTEYQVVEVLDGVRPLAVLECSLETGRTHQIRVHLASIGHPLVGDATYADRRPHLGVERPFLHAKELRVVHPDSGDVMSFSAPLAQDLHDALERFRSSEPNIEG